MLETPVVVGIPFYNDERFLAETVASVLGQTESGWRLILLDDGSTDRSPAIAADLAERDDRIVVIRQPNAGVAAGRNTIVQAAPPETELLLFLDHDDLLEPDALATLQRAAVDSPVGAHGIARNIDRDGALYHPGECETWCRLRLAVDDGELRPTPLDQPTTFAQLAYGQCIPTTGACLLRREALLAAGPWDPTIRGADDYDMYLRLTNLGRLAFVDRVVINYRWHGDNLSGDMRLMHRGYVASKRKVLRSPATTAEHRRVLRRSFRFTARQWARQHATQVPGLVKRGELRHAARTAALMARDMGWSVWGLR